MKSFLENHLKSCKVTKSNKMDEIQDKIQMNENDTECQYCNRMYPKISINTHIKSCELADSDLMRKSKNGYECVICNYKVGKRRGARSIVLNHIRNSHSNHEKTDQTSSEQVIKNDMTFQENSIEENIIPDSSAFNSKENMKDYSEVENLYYQDNQNMLAEENDLAEGE